MEPLAILKLAIPMGVMYFSSKLDAKDAGVLFAVRAGYAAAAVCVTLVLAFVYYRISATADATPVPARKESDDSPAVVEATTVGALDAACWASWAQQTAFGLLIPAAIHAYLGTPQVLLVSAAMAPMNLADAPLFKCYILGANLPRPFAKPKNALGDAMKKLVEPEAASSSSAAPAALSDAGSAAAALRKLREEAAAAEKKNAVDGLRKRA